LRPGEAYATPPGVPHAYRVHGAGVWRVCWAYYPSDDPAGFRFPLAAPAVVKLDVEPLRLAIEGLCTAANAAEAEIELWVRLVHLRVLAAVSAEALPDARLARLWAEVNQDLAHPWTLPELARTAALSREALRRLCLRHHGQSPLREVTRLRMQRAATLLRHTSDKVASIALRVGFTDPFAFSTAFKRVQGRPPGLYRRRPA
ncbi:MAG: AraC family transcriptional regulator, partial [Opitutales bacterium]